MPDQTRPNGKKKNTESSHTLLPSVAPGPTELPSFATNRTAITRWPVLLLLCTLCVQQHTYHTALFIPDHSKGGKEKKDGVVKIDRKATRQGGNALSVFVVAAVSQGSSGHGDEPRNAVFVACALYVWVAFMSLAETLLLTAPTVQYAGPFICLAWIYFHNW